MRRDQKKQAAPKALADLHEKGYEWAHIGDINYQMKLNDERYMQRRLALSKFLGKLKIDMDPMPPRGASGWSLCPITSELVKEGVFQSQINAVLEKDPKLNWLYRLRQPEQTAKPK